VNASWIIEEYGEGTCGMLVRGELDLEAVRPLVDAVSAFFEAAPQTTLVIDLREVRFIDSSGVRALLLLHQVHGERVRVGDVSEQVARVLEIAGLTGRLDGGGVGAQ
jgi:anti-anti-sigma factor